jgi:hypothetical protein
MTVESRFSAKSIKPTPVYVRGFDRSDRNPRSAGSLVGIQREIRPDLFFFWVNEILRFDLHFVFVLGLDCDDSRLKEGFVKIFGFVKDLYSGFVKAGFVQWVCEGFV